MPLSKAIGNVRLYTILILLATITVSSCISPSRVRHGNKKDYLLPSDIKQNTDTGIDLADAEEFDQNTKASSSALNPDQFNKDLKKVLENNKSSNGEEEIIDSELVIPELTQDDADELSKLTQELFDRKPEKNNEKLQTQASAVTGLPTLQNQIDAMKGTYLEYDTKLDNLTENITRVNGRLQVVESDISMLKKKVDELSKVRVADNPSTKSKDIRKSDNSGKKLKGYKLVSDEELEKESDISTNEKPRKNAQEVNSDFESQNSDSQDDELTELKKSMAYKVAMNSLSKKNYKQSTLQLNRLKNKYKSDLATAELNYWIGESAYGQKQYKKALGLFSSTSETTNSERADDASAMKAECMIKLGRVKEAKAEYREFIAQFPGSTLIPRARKMLQQL